MADAEAALENRPKDCTTLGNKGYALILLGSEAEAEEAFKLAFKYGDEKFYKATLEDAEFYPVPQDGDFVEMIKRFWKEEQARREALAAKPEPPTV